MNKKYIFFDIDGTLTNSNPGGIILPSTMRTLRKLEENGHFVAIATGRGAIMARDGMEESGIKNAVCCGGNGLIIDNEVRYIKPLEKEKALMVINECKKRNIAFGVMIDDSYYVHSHYKNAKEDLKELTFATIVPMEDDCYEKFEEIHKIHIALNRGEEEPLIPTLKASGLHYARYHHSALVVEPDDKYKGILDMIAIMGGKEEDVVVFGDGHNDISMVKQAAISIAMGNAIEQLKEHATFITKPNTENGIEYACQYFGWID